MALSFLVEVKGRSQRAASEAGGFQAEELLGLVAGGQALVVEAERRGPYQVADVLGVPEVVEGFAERDVEGMSHVVSPCFQLRAAPCGLSVGAGKPPQDGGAAHVQAKGRGSRRETALAACRLRRAVYDHGEKGPGRADTTGARREAGVRTGERIGRGGGAAGVAAAR